MRDGNYDALVSGCNKYNVVSLPMRDGNKPLSSISAATFSLLAYL